MRTEGKPFVLLVDDDRDLRQYARDLFIDLGHEFTTASNFDAALRVIHENENSLMVAFVDIHLKGQPSGFDLLHYVKTVARHRVVPYAYTGDSSVLVETRALEAGAYHVFHKGVDPLERLALYVEHSQVLKLVRNSAEDDLTGLYNFKTFRYFVTAELKTARARTHPEVFSLILIDVDHFKGVNDTHGYLHGDEALKRVGTVLKEHVRPSDHPCRKSGDEFIVVLPDADENAAFRAGKKLQEEVAASPVMGKSGQEFSFSISFGVGQIRRDEIEPDVESSFDELILRADTGIRGLKAMRAHERR